MSSSSSSSFSSSSSSSLKRYNGIVKQLDKEGFGFLIFYDGNKDVLVNPSSFSNRNLIRTIQQGDRVEFSLKAIDVIPTGPQCYCCGRLGHYASDCSHKTNPKVRCYRCGILGHYARDCFSSGGPRDPAQGTSNSATWKREDAHDDCDTKRMIRPTLVSVKNRRDMRRVEDVEDCFILEFNPTKITVDDDDDEEDGDDDDDDDGDDDDDDDDGHECRSIVCVKKAEDMKKVEEVEDCFILDFDPTEPITFSYLSLSEKSQLPSADEDVSILAEKGQVACRDYPHSRHICATHSFKSSPHELHCKMCYCYICDIPAPCKEWAKITGFQHCDATPELPLYKILRDRKKQEKG